MATYQIMYWQDIPSQVRVEEGAEEVKLSLGPDFEKLIDRKATKLGLVGTDEYLDQWHWGEELERPGSAQEVAEALVKELVANTDMV